MPAKGWSICEDTRSAPLVALVTAPFYHPAQWGSFCHVLGLHEGALAHRMW